ncbi:MAG: response regulator, partial [Campylobacteraceae bacterium]|nr:response regulator [Campylobacteraceae bacterium]
MKREEFKNIKILYVEDEDLIRENAISYLKRLFDHVYEAKDGFEALEVIKKENPHIIITDIKMPRMTGIELVKKIRENNSEVQIIMLTAFTDPEYLIPAVELGLVKYLIKPIMHNKIFPVLQQCVKNIKNKTLNIISISSLCSFDIFTKTLIHENKVIKLSKNELLLLNLLCVNVNRISTYKEIENNIWYDSFMSEDAIRSLIRNLRKKLPKECLEN